LARAEPGLLTLRILSALVLAPVAIAAVWFGTPWLALLTVVAGGGMAWEWVRLCRGGAIGNTGAVLIAAVLVAVIAAAVSGVLIAMAIAAAGAVIVFWVARHEQEPEPPWACCGSRCLACCCCGWPAPRPPGG
jgi:phosphatidate cytidylyltransferase